MLAVIAQGDTVRFSGASALNTDHESAVAIESRVNKIWQDAVSPFLLLLSRS